jgi:amino acid adenylation domain-containing protein
MSRGPIAGTDFHTHLRTRAAATPDRVALTFRPSTLLGDRVDLTYADLVAQSLRMSQALAQRLDRGQRVLLLLPPTPEFAIAFLGCLAAGVIAVPLPVPIDEGSRHRLVRVARDCAPGLILSMPLVRDLVAATAETAHLIDTYTWLSVDDIDLGANVAAEPPRPVSGEEVAFLQYTSGSTTSPRGVMVSHRSLMANEAAIHDVFAVSTESTVVTWLPLHHDMGLIGGLLQPLYAGARGVVLDPVSFVRRPVTWLEAISEERADISGAPNFAYDLCARKITTAETAGLDLSSWRIAFNGAAPVFVATMRSFTAAFQGVGFRPAAHMPCYGLAESTLLVTAAGATTSPPSRCFAAEALESGRALLAGPDTSAVRELVAYPLPQHAAIRVIDPSTVDTLGDGVSGEIVVAGDSSGSGYWGDPAATATAFGLTLPGEPATPYLRTGDLGFILDGQLFVQGRRKDLIIHRGRNLHPDDLEADVSTSHVGLRPGSAVVFGVPADGDEAVVVCQEVRDEVGPDLAPIAQAIRAVLARRHGVGVHTVVLVAPRTLARTTSGKPRRHLVRQRFLAGELRALYLHRAEPEPTTVAERLAATDTGPPREKGALTAWLCELLRDLLDLPATPTGSESLTSLGADSLTALRLQYELSEALGIVAPATLALRAPSIDELVAAAHRLGAGAGAEPTFPPAEPTFPSEELISSPEEPVSSPGEPAYELNAAQRGLWFLHHVDPHSTAYTITRAFRVTGDFEIDRFTAALGQVVERHTSLRLAVSTMDGLPWPSIRPPGPVPVEVVEARSWDEPAVSDWHHRFATTPFDLERDVLVRAAVLRRRDDWLVMLGLHHIVADGQSLAIIVDELATAYRNWPAHPLPTDHNGLSPGRYERTVLAQQRDALLAYWRRELAGEWPRLALPRPGRNERGNGAACVVALEAQQAVRLAALASARGLTLHSLLLSVWQILLHRLTGQPDLVVGVPTSGRADQRLARWVGHLVNVVPIRSSYDPGTRLVDFASRTHERVLDALDHRDLPLSELTGLVHPSRDSAVSWVLQAMFAYYAQPPGLAAAAMVAMGDPEATLSLGSGTLGAYELPDYTTQAEVCLNVYERSDTLELELQCDPRTVSVDQIAQLRTTIATLLEAIGNHPDTTLGRLPLLTATEVKDLVAASTGPRMARPQPYLHSFEQTAARHPQRCAADDGFTRISYAQLDERANHVAWRLREMGVGIDATVAVSAARGVDYLVALLGIHKADGCYVPISPTEASHRAAAMLAAVRPVAVIADPVGTGLLARVEMPATAVPVLELGALTAGRSTRRPPRSSPDQAGAYIIHTSGSTGPPKPVVLTNAGLTNHLWQMIEYFELGSDDCVGQTGPVSFDVSVWQLLAPLLIGARVRIVPEPASVSPAGLLKATVDGDVSMLELVPSAVAALLDAGLARSRSALRVMVATGEALSGDIPQRWAREMPTVPLYNAYGPCECTDDVSIGLSAAGQDRPTTVSIGRPLANTSMFVLDDDLRPAPIGVAGWLCVGGAGIGRGYLGNPRRTAEVFVPDPWSDTPGARLYRTGDLARMIASGDVEFLGRADSQIKVRGLRIEPGEVEAAVCACDGVVAAAVRLMPGAGGDYLAGFVVLAGADGNDDRDGDGGDDDGDAIEGRPLGPDEDVRIRTALADRLPRYMIPSVLVQVPRLRRSPNGKTDYRALRYVPPESSTLDDLPDDALAEEIRSIWASRLGRDTVTAQDNFFALGGHSLLALAMVDEVGRVAGAAVEVDTVFTHPQLRDFVAAVRRQPVRSPADGRPETRDTGAVRDRHRPVPASAAQQRFWFLHEMDSGHIFNMPGVLRLRGALDDAALEAALRDALGRHPVLLARFSDASGRLMWTQEALDGFELRRLDLRGAVAELGEGVFDHLAEIEARTPADLRGETPLRAMLAQLGPTDWRLFVCVHHIACDGWSLDLLLADLAAGYNQRVRGGPAPAIQRQLDFADYCHDEAFRHARREGFEVTPWWHSRPAGTFRLAPEPHRLAPGPGALWFSVDGEVDAALRELIGQTGSTPFTFFVTALAALIHSGAPQRETVLLGTLIAQRDSAWREVVGPLLNVSVLAIDVAPGDTVLEALDRSRQAVLWAHRASHLPYQELVAQLGPTLGGSLFEVLVVMQPEPAPLGFDGLTADLVEIDPGGSPYPLVVNIEPGDGGYRVTHRFAPDRYSAAQVGALAGRLEALIRAIVRAPHSTLDDLHREIAQG